MKNLLLMLAIFFFSTSCEEEVEQEREQENSIYGTWQLTERWLGNVLDTSINWMEVSNGYIISFREDNSFSSTEFTICSKNSGTFTLNQDSTNKNNFISLVQQCDYFTTNQLTIKYGYYFENSNLILSPYSHPCAEGCAFKFVKKSSYE